MPTPTSTISELPTPSQVLNLASRIPTKDPPMTPISTLLQPFLTLLETPWIFNFLFTSSPIHVQHLTSPTLSQTTFACALIATRVQSAPFLIRSPAQLPETHHLQARYLFTPAFMLDTVTAGFGVLDCTSHYISATDTNSWYIGCSQTLTCRFIKDNTKNSSYFVYDAPDSDLVLVYHNTFQSSTRSRAVTTVFLRSVLRPIVSSATTAPNFQTLLPALLMSHHEDQYHRCKVCQKTQSANCVCLFPTYKAAHPFDYDNFRRSMALHLGERESLANKCMFYDGQIGSRVVLGTREATYSFSDPTTVHQLALLALGKQFRNSRLDPRHSFLSLSYGPRDQLEITADSIYHEHSGSVGAASRGKDKISDTERNGALDQLMVDTNIVALPVVAPAQDPSDAVIAITSSAQEVSDDEDWWSAQCQQGLRVEQGKDPVSVEHGSTESQLATLAAAEAVIPDGETILIPPPAMNKDSTEIQETDAAKALEERRQKARQRRERNRAAARRSNLKRKEVRENLVAKVKLWHDRMEKLRSRELFLRQENIRLRNIVSLKENI